MEAMTTTTTLVFGSIDLIAVGRKFHYKGVGKNIG